MIDLLLVQPPMGARMGKDLGARILGPNIGLAYIAAYVEAQGHSVKVIDALAEELSPAHFAARVRELDPRFVGLSAMTYQIKSAGRAADLVKQGLPGATVLIGGSHASVLPERTLEEFGSFDVAVVGEGEITTLELLRGPLMAPQMPASDNPVPGACLRRDGRIEKGAPRPFIEDLDSLPFPAFHLFPLKNYFPFYSRTYKPELPISSSRGCPYRCSFCVTAMGKRIRLRSPESLVAEIRRDRDCFGVEQIVFTDENFTGNRERALAFCEQIVSAGLNRAINYICQSRVAVDRETLCAMRKANFTHITFGIESGNQEILDKAHKSITLAQSEQAVRWAHELGMVTDGNFILGLPYENRETILQTIRFARRLPLDYASFFLLVPYPGTEVMEMAKEGKAHLVLLSEDWDDYGKQVGGALAHRHLDRKTLESLQTLGYLTFYARPRRLWGLFKKISAMTAVRYLAHTIRSIAFSPSR